MAASTALRHVGSLVHQSTRGFCFIFTVMKSLWSNYRIQGHFGPPHLHVSEAFVERSI